MRHHLAPVRLQPDIGQEAFVPAKKPRRLKRGLKAHVAGPIPI